ncbi:MAG: hypothetical protein AB1512_20610 [Thermodesulfobacteriota bacterium]
MSAKRELSWGGVLVCILCSTVASGAALRDITVSEIKSYQENSLPVIVLAVDFQLDETLPTQIHGGSGRTTRTEQEAAQFPKMGFFTRDLIADKVFGLEDAKRQLNAYYRWASYGQIKLVPAQGLEQSLMAQVILRVKSRADLKERYTFDSRVGVIEELGQDKKIMRFLTDAVTAMLRDSTYKAVSFQDALLMLLVNISGREWGRGAMGFLPSGKYWEFGVGPDSKAPGNRICFPIGRDYTYRDYYLSRRECFDSRQDQFVQGVAMFCRDGQLSCAPHDIVNVLKRASGVPPKRHTVIKGLYNNYLQDIWQRDFRTNTSPYIGWWDVMADHLHMKIPEGPHPSMFFRSTPQGMCAYTRLVMGWMPEDYVATLSGRSRSVVLAPLGVNKLPEPRGKIHLVAKVPLAPAMDKEGNRKDRYYLIEARRFMNNDDVRVDKTQYYGDRTYLPDRLIQKEGVLVYRVDMGKPMFGPKPEKGKVDRRNFVLVLEDQAGRRDGDLKEAPFSPGQVFKGEEGVRVEVAADPANRKNYVIHVHR